MRMLGFDFALDYFYQVQLTETASCMLSALPWLLHKHTGLKLDLFVVTAGLFSTETTIVWLLTRHLPSTIAATKRRRTSTSGCESSVRPYIQPCTYKNGPSDNRNSSVCMGSLRPYTDTNQRPSYKRDRSEFEDEDLVFMSRDEIERCSPLRKDGIDAVQETRLRYSYFHFLQNLGIQLEIPQTTIGTVMVLCHRFFVRKSHACHDRFLISTAALFLAAKSEET
ncbi:CYCLIN domain-containing protein [Heracleum sosnowskyi]|uniref:CYCLIN domain-containing protein n=1 Tax=Heracleum sosnowskyi TaxID=360622 RepID=A0AAD8MY94_9APIA|nr:CYCLIN domain-containing protein [Heracleum sosnowskyi]